MKRVHLLCTIMVILTVFSALAAETVQGVVRDSITGSFLPSVKVKVASPVCSTYTDQVGRFYLSIPLPVSVVPSPVQSRRVVRFDFDDREGSGFRILDLKGSSVYGNRTGRGIRIFMVGGNERAYKAINIADNRQIVMSIPVEGSVTEVRAMAKAAASSYPVVFQKPGYDPLQRNLSSGQDVDVKLLPSSSSGVIDVKVDTLGTTTITVEIK